MKAKKNGQKGKGREEKGRGPYVNDGNAIFAWEAIWLEVTGEDVELEPGGDLGVLELL